MDTSVGFVVGGGFALLLLFIVLREFATWYWKQSEQVRLLKAIEGHLEALEARSRGAAPRPASSPAAYPGAVPAVDASGRKLTFMERLG